MLLSVLARVVPRRVSSRHLSLRFITSPLQPTTPFGRISFYDLGGVQVQVVESGNIEPALADSPAILLQQDLRVDHFTLRIDSAEAFASSPIRTVT